MKVKSFLIGTLPPPKGGQAAITKFVSEIKVFDFVLDTTKRSNMFFVYYILNVLRLLIYRYQKTSVYCVISRGKISILRELIYLIILKPNKCINHLHGNDFEWIFEDNFYAKAVRKIYIKHISLTLCVNEYQSDFFDQWGLPNKKITNPIVDAYSNKYKSYVKPNYIGNRSYDFGYISFVMSSKGIFDVLQKFEDLLKLKPKAKLLIAGEIQGDYEMDLFKTKKLFLFTISNLNNDFPGCIDYLGHVNGVDKIKFFKNIKYLLFFSRFRSESFGLVLIEAMDFGVMPVVNSNPVLRKTLLNFDYIELLSNETLLDIYTSDVCEKEINKNLIMVRENYYPEKFINKILKHI
jgi:glycosyltransferase involved in cell wall biosynthesis